jgi:hypothetical protein
MVANYRPAISTIVTSVRGDVRIACTFRTCQQVSIDRRAVRELGC